MNEEQQAKWHRMQKRGMWLYLLRKATITAILYFLLVTVLEDGNISLLTRGKWIEYLQGVNWFRYVWLGFIVGFSLGLYNWNKYKKAFEQPHP